MQLPAQAQNVYADWWKFTSYAAAHRDASGAYAYTSTDFISAVSEIARAESRSLGFTDFTGLSQLFGIARTIERSGDRLTGAADSASLTADMIAQPPWARSAGVQSAAPEWQLRAEITYRTPDGLVITDWGTGVFKLALHATVGQMRAEAEFQFQRMLARRTEQRHTGGELLSIGRMQLLAV